MSEWLNPQEQPPAPGDHIKIVMEDGIVLTGCAKDFKEPFLIYQMIQPDPFVGRQNAEQPVVKPQVSRYQDIKIPPAGPRRYRVRKTATNILTLESDSWEETYRWRWLAKLQVLLSRIPHSATTYIYAEIIDEH